MRNRRKAIKIFHVIFFFYPLAKIYYRKKQYDRSIDCCKKIDANNSYRKIVLVLIGNSNRAMDDIQNAID